MIPPSLQLTIGVGILAWAIGTGTAWYVTSEYKDGIWSAQVEATRAEAAELAKTETEKVLAAERDARSKVATLEVQHVELQNKLGQASRDARRLVRERGMRDPGRQASCPGAVPGAATVPGDPAVAAGAGAELSTEATEFLLQLTEEADRAAVFAGTCDAYAKLVTQPVVGETEED